MLKLVPCSPDTDSLLVKPIDIRELERLFEKLVDAQEG